MPDIAAEVKIKPKLTAGQTYRMEWRAWQSKRTESSSDGVFKAGYLYG